MKYFRVCVLSMSVCFMFITFSSNGQKGFELACKCTEMYFKLDSLEKNLKEKDYVTLMEKCKDVVNVKGYSYEMSKFFFKNHDYKNGVKKLKSFIKYGGSFQTITKDSIQLKVRDYNKIFSLSKKVIKNRDSTLENFLLKLKHNDQLYRNQISLNSKFSDSLWLLQSKMDSINVLELKAYILKNNWPDIKKYNFNFSLNPSLISIHSSEKDNIFFIDHAIASAVKHNNDWISTESMMMNLSWRFQFVDAKGMKVENGFNKLRYVYTQGKRRINKKRSILQTHAIAQLNNDNNRDIEIFLCYQNDKQRQKFEKNKTFLLKGLEEFIREQGFRGNIFINYQLHHVINDNLNKFIFGYKISTKK